MKKKILPDLSTRLKKIRQQTGCDKKEMADRLGVTTSGYYKNEHGDTLPSVSSLKRKNLQAECKKRDEVLTKLQEKTTFIESRPEMQELLEYIEKVPIFYHKLMVFFQEYKMEHNKPGRSK